MADYDVVLLVEEQLNDLDAQQVRALHEGIDDPVTYHVLLPLDDAAARVEASLGTLGGADLLGSPGMPIDVGELQDLEEECEERSHQALTASVAALERVGATVASSAVVTASPTDALAAKVHDVDGREAIVLTRPHVVAEFFHVDWSSQARRKLGVPVLHLIEHQNLDEQAEGL
ncbi:hypothetical protein [Nocardioides sp. R-C-SC26]|uniref:hypothetical protein n=1 Tax=Nocardioides sp. R-C-SC26 TaxID=2870414 RepID=UPI001E451DD8|nr:hypothetical protein [Nocardioides sp. R-C-SC26]